MKKIIIFLSLILFIFFLPAIDIRAETAEDPLQQGAVLYLEAGSALAQKDFSQAKLKYEQAAQYLSGETQEQAIRMAEFMSKMSPEITSQPILRENSDFDIVGEIKEEGKIWHLYYSPDDLSLMHIALTGEKDLDKIAEVVGADLFNHQLVIKDTSGYLSQELSSLPDVSSKIRMWYCQQDNTTNIVYESYSGSTDILQHKAAIIDEAFRKVECHYSQPKYIWPLIIIGLIVLAALLIWRFKLCQKISKKILLLVLAILVITTFIIVFIM